MLANSSNYSNASFSKEKDNSEYSQQHSSSGKFSHSSRCNASNKYCEEYSFNKQSQRESNVSYKNKQVYRPNGVQEGDSISHRNPQLILKYSSIYNELQEIDSLQVIHLFLEQIEQNQRNREKMLITQRHMKGLEEQIVQLKSLLQKKREAIRRLCETQSNNLNLIECLQRQGDRHFNFDSHFLAKYRELQTYMNEYICSTNEAQEQFSRKYKLLKMDCQRLTQTNEKLYHQKVQNSKYLEITRLRVTKFQESLTLFRQKQRNLAIKIENLEEENASLQKEIEELIGTLRANEQYQNELTKQNKELSSELDFIREKINQNQNLSKDLFEKMEEHSELNQKLTLQKENLQGFISKLRAQNQTFLRQKQQFSSNLNTLMKQSNSLRENHQQLINAVHQKQKYIEELQQQLEHLRNQEEELLMEYQHQKQSKQAIKSQLIQLAQQVKFMESTYKKEICQNQKIKEQLQRFWERNRTHPLKQAQSTNHHQTNSIHSMKTSKVQSRSFKENYQHQALF